MDRALEVLREATALDTSGKYPEALDKYRLGIQLTIAVIRGAFWVLCPLGASRS